MREIIIVDDEAASRSFMRSVIEDPKYDLKCVVTGEAADGMEAIELFQTEMPDIVLMDINMPFKDGLEVLQEMRLLRRSARIVIVTGHNDFSYAQKALNLGARFLLLKPVVELELVESIRKVSNEINAELMEKARWRSIGTVLEQNMPILQRNFFEKFLTGNNYDSKQLYEIGEMLGIQLQADCYFCVCIQSQNCNTSETDYLAVENILQSVAGDYGVISYSYLNAQNQIVVFFCLQQEAVERKDALLQEIGQTIFGFLEQMPFIGVGSMTTRLELLRSSYLEAIQAVNCRRLFYGSSVGEYRDVGRIGSRTGYYTSQDIESILVAYRNGEIEQAKECIYELFRRVENIPNRNYEKNLTMEVISVLRRCLTEWNIDTDSADRREKLILDGQIKTGYAELLIQLLEELNLQQEACIEHRVSKRIQLALSFIQDAYSDPELTVQMVAEHAELSTGYFCSLFFAQTGVHFNEYLTSVRIHAAKQMLREGKRKVFEIALDTGFGDPKYFSAKFKKLVGCTPSEYRDQ